MGVYFARVHAHTCPGPHTSSSLTLSNELFLSSTRVTGFAGPAALGAVAEAAGGCEPGGGALRRPADG